MDEKVYSQEVIYDNPFPGELQLIPLANQTNPAGTFSPTVSKDKTFPVKRTAVELLSSALNTRSKRILQEFQLQDTGGFRVGDFKEGINGDLRITPNGLTARDIAGITTFAIDGADGSAFFRGTVQAADFVIADENGLISLANFQSDFYSDDTNISTSSASYVDVSGSSLSFNLVRQTNVLISFYALVNTLGTSANITYTTDVTITIDGVAQSPQASASWFSGTAISFVKGDNVSCARIFTLNTGDHTIKLQWRSTSNPQSEMLTRNLSYMVLGS